MCIRIGDEKGHKGKKRTYGSHKPYTRKMGGEKTGGGNGETSTSSRSK